MDSFALHPVHYDSHVSHGLYSSPSSIGTVRYSPPVYPSLVPHKLLDAAVFRPGFGRSVDFKVFPWATARALAMDVTEEPQISSNNTLKPFFIHDVVRPLPARNYADDVSLHNPLLRLHRMGCGWLGVIMEWDGVVVEDDGKLDQKAWSALAEEECKSPPPQFILRKIEGMKSEQAISEVFCWSRNPREVKRLSHRKEDLFQDIQGGIYRLKAGSYELLRSLKKHNIPMAVASTRLRKHVEKALKALQLEGFFNVIVTAEDVYRGKPDPEMYMYAAQALSITPLRCIVIGNSNASIEAAHDAFMKCIAVTGRHPTYELGAADLVIPRLDKLSMVDLKNLADLNSPEFQPPEPEPEPESEEEPASQTRTACQDW